MRKLTYLFLSILFVAGVVGVVNAQQAFPEGGEGFTDAVILEPGEYDQFTLGGDEIGYYKITVNPGQALNISSEVRCVNQSRGGAYDFGFILYDQERTRVKRNIQIVDCHYFQFDKRKLSWLATAEAESNDYYLALGCENSGEGVIVRDFKISLEDYYDVGSSTDTSGSFDNPIVLTESGTYSGYLGDADEADYYKFSVQDETTLTAKVTPPSDASFIVTVYDPDRSQVNKEYPKNPGAIVTNTAPIEKAGNAFIAIEPGVVPEGEIVKYDLEISTEKGIEESAKSKYSDEWAEGMKEAEKAMKDLEKELGGKEGLEETAKEAGKWIKRGFMGVLFYTIIPFVVGFLVLIGIIVVIVVIVKKKKKK